MAVTTYEALEAYERNRKKIKEQREEIKKLKRRIRYLEKKLEK